MKQQAGSAGSMLATTLHIPAFLLGIAVLLYIASFVVFAFIRIVTGISIQRLGYLSLKRISYEPRDGIRVEIRKLGILFHRPTYAQPSWVSLIIADSQVTVDVRKKAIEKDGRNELKKANGSATGQNKEGPDSASKEEQKAPFWEDTHRIKRIMEKVRRLVGYMKMLDIIFTNANLTILEVGSIQIGSVTISVDTRREAADRSRLFDHCKALKPDQSPLEFMLTTRSVLFTPDRKEKHEVLDHCMFNAYGVLEDGIDGILDSAMAIKFGRINMPCDEIMNCITKFRLMKNPGQKLRKSKLEKSLGILMEEAMAGSRTDRMAEAVMEWRVLLKTLLEGIKEVQLAIGHLVVSKRVESVQPGGKPISFTVMMKELGVDLHRLDQKSPAHQMYFSPKDLAHQALLAAISISISVDDGRGNVDKLVYMPMVTMTSRTTLPAKILQLVEKSDSDRNTNMLFATVVITSPSVDLEPRHLPLLMAMFQSKSKSSRSKTERTKLMSRLLPKASIKFSIHEPVIRIVLPSRDPKDRSVGSMDMLISSLSSISADIEASHTTHDAHSHYSLTSALRVASHSLYYRSSCGERHDLLQTETLDIRAQVHASPEVHVNATAFLDTLIIRLVKPEIVQGIKQMVTQFHRHVKSDKQRAPDNGEKISFVRKLPMWLNQLKLEGRDFSVEVAGVDADVSQTVRGAAIDLDSWTIDYKCQRYEGSKIPIRRRAASRALSPEEALGHMRYIKHPKNPTDGRKMTISLHGLECFKVEDVWENEPFLVVPDLELSFSTSTESEGQTLSVGGNLKRISLNYSLYRHYCIIVAAKVLKETFTESKEARSAPRSPTAGKSPIMGPRINFMPSRSPDRNSLSAWGEFGMDMVASPISQPEFISVGIQVGHIQMKAVFVNGPSMMFEAFGVEAGRQKWGFPFLRARNMRLYADSPTVKGSWARLVSLRNMQLTLKDSKTNSGASAVEEKSEKAIDLDAEAIRIAVPHQLILYKVTDSIINATKASQQLHHRLKTGSNDFIFLKTAEGPKRVPRIALRTKALLFELEDDPFETQLCLIYRVGLLEQKMRLAREAAFDVKVQKIRENEQRLNEEYEAQRTATGATMFAEQRSRFRGRTKTFKVEQATPQKPSRLRRNRAASTGGKRQMRYDPESAVGPSEAAAVSIDEARRKLNEHNSATWIRRIKWAQEQQALRVAEKRKAFWGEDEVPVDVEEAEPVLSLPNRPSLMAAYVHDVDLVVDKPSFPLSELSKFMYDVGKGLPEDTKFSLLLPVSIKVDFSEARILLRDYPLPFIHVPQMRPDQTTRASSWSLKSDFVIAEELRDLSSMRTVNVKIVPPSEDIIGEENGYDIVVRRTVSAVKSYSNIHVSINTGYATRITWCTSYQPAIQDMMMVFETFSKPHLDPSERTGFWDKLRLIFHSRIGLKWNGDGDVHVTLKGSRDPYKVTGNGAGFVLCLRGDVSWDIARDEDPKKFLQVEADEFLLAIPDFSNQAKDEVDVTPSEDRSIASSNSYKEGALFKKVIMKLGGRVRVIIGLMFEQDLGGEGDWKTRKRSFEFIPHYAVTLRTPEYVKALGLEEGYDAFKGFRSHYLHLSISVISPIERDWSDPNSAPSESYNTIHLTPKFFTHFYAWWQLFAGNMSLPIRQGALWPGPEKTAKKFGRHLATIKYQLLLSPLFISHMYMHKQHDNTANMAATGLKVKLDSFLVDMHMRREETTTTIKGLNLARKSFGMKLNQAELDFHSADIRAVSANIQAPTIADLKQAIDEPMSSATGTIRFSGDLSQFTIPDGDYSWVDMDDFIELDMVLPSSKTPETMIMPLAFAPRFTFFRQTDHTGPDAHGSEKPSTFGQESTHDCIMSQNNDPREIQYELIQSRLERVHLQVKKNKQSLDELAGEIAKRPDDVELKEASQNLIQQSSVIYDKIKFLERMLRRMSQQQEGSETGYSSDQPDKSENGRASIESEFGIDSSPFGEYNNDFDNRFIVHNMQAKWSNTLRNIIIRYIHQVNQRRGIVYYMSRRAIKFILDIVEEQGHEGLSEYSPTSERGSSTASDTHSIESRLQQLLNDPVKFVVANDNLQGGPKSEHIEATFEGENLASDISEDYLALNSYHVRLIAPQIQLQSEKNKSAAVLVSTQGMQLKIVSIMDRQRLGDEVSGLVQQRFSLNMDNTQFFVSHKKEFVSESMWLHSANQYGAPTGSSWPPWVPLESMFDFYTSPVGFSRVVERTSATLRYDKHNSLRLKYSDQVNGSENTSVPTDSGTPSEGERRIDHVWVKFPKVQASCDSAQYFAMYVIVLDLLLYTEPTEKLRSEKLEKIMLASDFSDLRGAPEMVECLQNRINQLQEIKNYFQINARELDDKGWEDSLALAHDLSNSEDELFFMMKAITTAQRRYEDKGGQSSGVLRWDISANEIIWHLLREQNDPLVDIRLDDAAYSRLDNADGSNYNTVEVAMMKGYNQLPNAVYPEMIAPFFDQYRTPGEIRQTKILRVFWHMLEAIAGIPIMDHFEVNVFPLKIQLEREIGEKVFEYIFPGLGNEESASSASGNTAVGVSPFIVQPSKIPHVGVEEREDSSDSEEERQVESPVDDRSINLSSTDKLRPTLPPRPATSYSAYKSSSAFLSSGYEKSIRSFMPSRTPTTPIANESPKGRRSNESALPPVLTPVATGGEKRKRSLFQRSSSQGQQDKPSDELSQMMSRASNYMTLAYIKIPSVVLCLSYKGRGDRNIEDVHEFVFRMPMLEYRNKTWSNLDLALRLKKDIIKALISHTGAILENKITHHRPTKQQPNLLRMMANNTALGTSNPKLDSSSDTNIFQGDFTDLPGDPLTLARTIQTIRPGGGLGESSRSSSHHHSTGHNSVASYDSGITSTSNSEGGSGAGGQIGPGTLPTRPTTASEDRQQSNSSFHNTLSRHLSQLAIHARHKEGIDGDTEESTKKKGRMLLGKKMFGS